MATEAHVNLSVTYTDYDQVKRLIEAAIEHVNRAKEKYSLTHPDECYEPTMGELWRALLALQSWTETGK